MKLYSNANNLNINSVKLPGGKHSFAHSIACGALTQECCFNNVPNIRDSRVICEILKNIFEDVVFDKDLHRLELKKPIHSASIVITNEQLEQSRNIFCILPALLNRAEEVVIVGIPKGCDIGNRPTDWYYSILNKFGVESVQCEGQLILRWKQKRAAKIRFDYPTMTGTVIALACASIAEGRSELSNCSVETSCYDQILCMKHLGIDVIGDLPDLEVNTGMLREKLQFTCTCDRVYAVTVLSAAILAEVNFKVYSESEIRIPKFVEFMEKLNLNVIDNGTSIEVVWKNKEPLRAVSLDAGSEPKYSSDWVTFALLILSTKSNGLSEITDDVFLKRFQFIYCYDDKENFENVELSNTVVNGRYAVVAKINGKYRKSIPGGMTKICPDIRGSAAIVLSAIISEQPIEFNDEFQVSRGYEDLIGDMKKIGLLRRD